MEHTKDSCKLRVKTSIDDCLWSTVVTYNRTPTAIVLMAMDIEKDCGEAVAMAESAVINLTGMVQDLTGIRIEQCPYCKQYYIDGEGVIDFCSDECGYDFHGRAIWEATKSEYGKTL